MLLILCVVLGLKAPFYFRTVLYIQLFALLIPFILKPVVLILVNPAPLVSDDFADLRILSLRGDYLSSLREILFLPLVNLITVFVGLIIVKSRFQRRVSYLTLNNAQSIFISFMLLNILSFLSNILFNFGLSNPFIRPILELGTTISCVSLIILARAGVSSRFLLTFMFGLVNTLFFTFSNGFSKAPALTVLVFLVIVLVSKIKKIGIVYLSLGSLLIFVFYQVFLFLQSNHLGESYKLLVDETSQRYPSSLKQALPFFQRFDLLRAVTDAYYAGVGSWLTPLEYINEILSALFWNFGFSGLNFGARWAKEVAALSNSGQANTGVSLSQGTAAEGWIIAGYPGIIIVTLTLFFVCWRIFSNPEKGIYSLFLAAEIISRGAIFEQGLVGNFEQLTESLKALAIFFVVMKISSQRIRP